MKDRSESRVGHLVPVGWINGQSHPNHRMTPTGSVDGPGCSGMVSDKLLFDILRGRSEGESDCI